VSCILCDKPTTSQGCTATSPSIPRYEALHRSGYTLTTSWKDLEKPSVVCSALRAEWSAEETSSSFVQVLAPRGTDEPPTTLLLCFCSVLRFFSLYPFALNFWMQASNHDSPTCTPTSTTPAAVWQLSFRCLALRTTPGSERSKPVRTATISKSEECCLCPLARQPIHSREPFPSRRYFCQPLSQPPESIICWSVQ
jgi:hypothetical protein